ncbi:MAG: hypothetical protein ABR569_01690 [Gaiellaceae bacterium]
MHDNPKPTEEEQELAQQGRQQEEDAMRGQGHDDPDEQADRAGTKE